MARPIIRPMCGGRARRMRIAGRRHLPFALSTGAEQSLSIGNEISASLMEVVKALAIRPRHMIANGGITSSDLATKTLGVQRAIVMGRILPGAPVWQLRLKPNTRVFPM